MGVLAALATTTWRTGLPRITIPFGATAQPTRAALGAATVLPAMRGLLMQSTTFCEPSVRLTTQREDNTLIITVTGDIDLDTVAPVRHALSAADLGPGQIIALDLSGVHFADATLINALLQARTRWGPGSVAVTASSSCVGRLLSLADLGALFAPHAIPARRHLVAP